jgi:predicted acetyltransferase
MDLVFRSANNDDLDRLIEVHSTAFPDSRGVEERRRNLVSNPLGGLEDLLVAELGGRLVAHAFLFRLEAFFGGRRVKVGGVASVGVAPEVRRQGVGAALLAHAHAVSDVHGDALTMLYAFRQRFYARLGYASTTSRKRLDIDPRSIPDAWRHGVVRAALGEDKAAIARVHERAAEAASGWLARPAALWERRFLRERRHHIVLEGEGGELAGYVAFQLVQEQSHAETRLDVDEIVAVDDAARRALWGALGAMGDQIAEISVEVDATDPVELALLDADGRRYGTSDVEHPLGVVVGGPMVRIEDATRALEARGYAASGSFDLVLDDEMALHVRAEGGRAEVSAARGGSAVRTSRRGLAALLYGGVRLGDAVRLGLAAAEPKLLAKVEPVLALPPLLPLDPF